MLAICSCISQGPRWRLGALWELQAFRYLFLALWFGLHAFVAAQAYKVRILTQLVRLPIPSRLGDRRIATEVGRALRQIS